MDEVRTDLPRRVGSPRPLVLVAIPTYRRPSSLRRLLDSGLAQDWPRHAQVVVFDNDPDASAAALRDHPSLEGGGYVLVPRPGVAAVRNAALDYAMSVVADYIAFIDDDMVPAQGWLGALLRTATEHDADIVVGPILQRDDVLARPGARAMLVRQPRHEGWRLTDDLVSGNMLLRSQFVRRAELRFDESFGRSGGEDTYFGRVARQRGAVLAFADDATVTEHNDPAVIGSVALIRRAYGNGRALSMIDQRVGRHHRAVTRAARLVTVVPLAAGATARAILVRDGVEVWRQLFRVARHVGQARGAGHAAVGHYRGLGTYELPERPAPGRFPTVAVGPFQVADLTADEIVDVLVQLMDGARTTTAFALHISGLNARRRTDYVAAMARADLVYADGFAVVLLARLAGAARIQRAPTTDIGWQVLRLYAERLGRPARTALIGGPEGLARRAGDRLSTDAPVAVVHTASGYTRNWPAEASRLNAANPDMVLLGLGTPKEVLVADSVRQALPPTLVMTCGGWFGFLTGEERRAPLWAQRAGLEWSVRLGQAPRRLAPRYARGVVSVAVMAIGTLGRRALQGGG